MQAECNYAASLFWDFVGIYYDMLGDVQAYNKWLWIKEWMATTGDRERWKELTKYKFHKGAWERRLYIVRNIGRAIWFERSGSGIDIRTLDRENPSSNLVLRYKTFGKFVHSTLLQFTQLYK